MRSSNVQTRPLNAANADAKSILSELFITWASDPDVVAQLEKVIRLKLDEVSHSANKYIPNSRGSSGTNAPVGSNGEAPRGNSSNNRSAPYAAASSSSSSSSSATKPSANTGRSGSGATTPTNRYADPSDEMAVRAVSPAATPPGRGAVDSPPASARFLGVDEVDFSNKRAVSPGITPTSPHVKPVVDPTVPLPHSSVSPPGTHPLEAVELPTENSFSHESHTSRLVHSVTGRYATHPPANVQQASLMEIPVFYTATESEGILAASTEERTALLEALTENTYKYGDLKEIVRVLRLPYWWKDLLFDVIANSLGVPTTAEASISLHQIMQYFDKELSSLSRSRRMFHLIRGSGEEEFLTQADLKRMVKYLITSHPSLQFLVDSEFQDFYCRTVAIRMIYAMERQYSGHIHWRDFDRSNLPEVFREVDERDVNMVLEYFSYEHFYVLYCKFWELDTDRDSLVNYNDLCSYAQGSIVPAVIQRVVDGFGRPLSSNVPGCLNFEDFVYFCLSEEDKNSEAATLYWFRVLDTDGDGVLSGYELFQFYVENHQRILECLDPESGEFAYDDTMCQMMDMLGLQQNKKQVGITLGDLRGCTTASHFFNMIFNAPKFFMFEHREPFRDYDLRRGYERTDWDRYARAEYDRMSAESE